MAMARKILITATALLIAAPLVAQAQSFRCVGKDGRKYYGSTIPQECLGQPIEQLNRQGMVIKRIDPEGSEKERLAKEAEVLRAGAEGRRERRRVENEKRLDNGCVHAFGQALGGFAPGVCPKCGLEQAKPAGDCDHVWRRSQGAVPSSYCEKCGKGVRYGVRGEGKNKVRICRNCGREV